MSGASASFGLDIQLFSLSKKLNNAIGITCFRDFFDIMLSAKNL